MPGLTVTKCTTTVVSGALVWGLYELYITIIFLNGSNATTSLKASSAMNFRDLRVQSK